MDEGIDFKKLFVWFALFVCAVVYVRSNYALEDVLKFSREHPHPEISPRVDYYIGWMEFQRSNYEKSHQAFDQLLTDYPTCQYAPDALFRKAWMYTDNYKYPEARKMYSKYMEEFPEGPEIHKVQKKYEYIRFK